MQVAQVIEDRGCALLSSDGRHRLQLRVAAQPQDLQVLQLRQLDRQLRQLVVAQAERLQVGQLSDLRRQAGEAVAVEVQGMSAQPLRKHCISSSPVAASPRR